jgi:hypothetical protein
VGPSLRSSRSNISLRHALQVLSDTEIAWIESRPTCARPLQKGSQWKSRWAAV